MDESQRPTSAASAIATRSASGSTARRHEKRCDRSDERAPRLVPVRRARRRSSRRVEGCSSASKAPTARGSRPRRKLLRETLAAEGRDVVLTREPGGTELGERARELVLNGPQMGAWAEAALYAASRAEHVEEVIRPALDRGAIVVCDRYIDSSLAYQGVGRGLGVEAVLQLNLAVTGGLLPDVTFLLLRRSRGRGRSLRRSQIGSSGQGLALQAARSTPRTASSRERFPERIVTVDADRSPDVIRDEIREQLRQRS